jgi:hypothetical protein
VCWTMWLKFVPAAIMAPDLMACPMTTSTRPSPNSVLRRVEGSHCRLGKKKLLRTHSRRAVVCAIL